MKTFVLSWVCMTNKKIIYQIFHCCCIFIKSLSNSLSISLSFSLCKCLQHSQNSNLSWNWLACSYKRKRHYPYSIYIYAFSGQVWKDRFQWKNILAETIWDRCGLRPGEFIRLLALGDAHHSTWCHNVCKSHKEMCPKKSCNFGHWDLTSGLSEINHQIFAN